MLITFVATTTLRIALFRLSTTRFVSSAAMRTINLNDKPQFVALFTDELRKLQSVFAKHGHELRIAGGAVRDLLMDESPKDIDLATTATPDEMKEIFSAEDIRMIHTRGETHGTVTARINDKENFEVTTLRIDTATDGRHAQVQFTTDWQKDANRRDLTVNSMFLGLDGIVYDYFGGLDDVAERNVRFVGVPAERIREDYLRILRYFRFYGRIAKNPDEHDPSTLDAIKENVSGLTRVSGERIWVELKKILMGNHVIHLVPVMIDAGLASYIGLPENPPVETFKCVYERMSKLNPQPMTLIATLLKNEEEMLRFNSRLKLSADERDLGLFVVGHRDDKPVSNPQTQHPMRPYQLLVLRGCRSGGQKKKQVERVGEIFKYRGESERLVEFLRWNPPRCPIDGHVLRERGVRNTKQFSMILDSLLEHWVDSGFRLTRDQLLEQLEPILEKLGAK